MGSVKYKLARLDRQLGIYKAMHPKRFKVKMQLHLLYNYFMKTHLDHPADRNNDMPQERPAPGPRVHWACCLRALNPLADLVTPSASSDPAIEIALLPNDVSGNTSMLSAYYLSFYE